MTKEKNRIWYDITMSLTYPSVLGAIIYFFFDAAIQVSVLPFLATITTSTNTNIVTQQHFFEAFGMSRGWGFALFIIITLTISIHHSVDYLYSKYSEFSYGLQNFLWDIGIAFLLAIAYITISRGAINSFQYLKYAFSIFWSTLAVTYFIFIRWDRNAYLEWQDSDKELAIFYKNMIQWFEILALSSFIIFAITPLFFNRMSIYTSAYVIISVLTLGVLSAWFCSKVYRLEILTRTRENKMNTGRRKSEDENILSVRSMELSDIEICAQLFAETYQDVYSEPWTQKTSENRLQELFETCPTYCFTLEIHNKIEGFLLARSFSWFDGKRIWLEEIVIQKKYRGKGYGKLLLQSFFDKCAQDNVVGIALISEKHSSAYKIYQKMGLNSSTWIHMEGDLKDIGKI